MAKKTATYGQTQIDLALQTSGSKWVEGLKQLVKTNRVSLAENLDPGTVLEALPVNENDLSLKYLTARNLKPVTGQIHIPGPKDISALALDVDQVRVRWSNEVEGVPLIVYRSKTQNGKYEQVAVLAAGSTEYIDGNRTENTSYYYRVRYDWHYRYVNSNKGFTGGLGVNWTLFTDEEDGTFFQDYPTN